MIAFILKDPEYDWEAEGFDILLPPSDALWEGDIMYFHNYIIREPRRRSPNFPANKFEWNFYISMLWSLCTFPQSGSLFSRANKLNLPPAYQCHNYQEENQRKTCPSFKSHQVDEAATLQWWPSRTQGQGQLGGGLNVGGGQGRGEQWGENGDNYNWTTI